MKWPVEHKIRIGFGVVLGLLCVMGLAAYSSTQALLSTSRWVVHTHEVIETLKTGFAQVATAESGAHEYALSGVPEDRVAANLGLAEVPRTFDRLRELTADNSRQQYRLGVLEVVLAKRLGLARRLIVTRERQGIGSAAALVQAAHPRQLMQQSLRLMQDMEREELVLLEARDHDARNSARTTNFILAFGSALALCAVGGALALIQRDLVRRQLSEAALRTSEQRLQAILDNTTAIIYLQDIHGHYLLVNRSFERLAGVDRGEIVGRPLDKLVPEAIVEGLRAHNAEVFKSQVPMSFDETIVLAEGPRTFLSVKCALRDRNGTVYAMCCVATDITERRENELQALSMNNQLARRAAELEAAYAEAEAFAYSVSHDLRAPLRHVSGFADLLSRRVRSTLDATEQHYLDNIAESAGRMGTLIDDLLGLSRLGRVEMKTTTVNLAPLTAKVVRELVPDAATRTIQWNIGPLPEVQGDPSLLRLVLENLISNAIKYTGTREVARIDVAAEEQDDQVVISIHDNGVGFQKEYAHKLFGVFQRLHREEEFEGTGIGLANVRRIVHRHGGRTWAEGAIDQGATFYFALPRVNKLRRAA